MTRINDALTLIGPFSVAEHSHRPKKFTCVRFCDRLLCVCRCNSITTALILCYLSNCLKMRPQNTLTAYARSRRTVILYRQSSLSYGFDRQFRSEHEPTFKFSRSKKPARKGRKQHGFLLSQQMSLCIRWQKSDPSISKCISSLLLWSESELLLVK